jgi:CO/xanthine dehydrogenase FAD-binding subunit
LRHYSYYKPRTISEALCLKKEIPGAMFLAGGTDLMVQIKNKEVSPRSLISLRSIPELSSIDINGGARIGALSTVADLIQHPGIRSRYPLLVDAARLLGSPQIRNVATIGGNLCNCSPSADLALPLLVLEAKIRLRNEKGIQNVPIKKFFKGPGDCCLSSDQILKDIILDPPFPNTKAVFLKKGRVKMDLAVASLAVLLEMEGPECKKARMAAGSVGPVPMRLEKVEDLLKGNRISPELVLQAARLARKIVSPITDIRGTEEYRREIVGVFVKRSLEFLLGWRTS